jgi:hypothetical protein
MGCRMVLDLPTGFPSSFSLVSRQFWYLGLSYSIQDQQRLTDLPEYLELDLLADIHLCTALALLMLT